MAKIRFSSKAVEDLTSIWNYTYRTWSERQADEYYNMLVSSCKKVVSSAFRLAKSYGDIHIVRILHERMDVKRHLGD